MNRLRTYGRMEKVSEKVKAEADEFRSVYALVDARSDGRCETTLDGVRCPRRASDHHHLVKPRRSNHAPDVIVHLCRGHHERTEYPYKRGRLTVLALGQGRFVFRIVTAVDKFALGRSGDAAP